MLSNPLFTPFSYDSYYDPYRAERRYYEQRMRQQEARRQAEQEYRLKLLQRQRQQEAERRYKLDLIRRMQAAEEERRQANDGGDTRQKLATESAQQRQTITIPVETAEKEEEVSTSTTVASTTSDDSESESVTSDQEAQVKEVAPEKLLKATLPNDGNRSKQGYNQQPRRTILDRKSLVVVEDASDSEDGDDILKSVWRNRRPSPGNWMEPVEHRIAV